MALILFPLWQGSTNLHLTHVCSQESGSSTKRKWIHIIPYHAKYGSVLRIREFISDPNFFHPGSRVKKIPGSRIRIRIKEFKYKLFLSSRKYDPGCLSRIPYPSRIQGSKSKSTGYQIPDPDPQYWYGSNQSGSECITPLVPVL